MCDFFKWETDDEERKIAHENFKNAMVHQFNSLYGTDVNDIESWQKLCLALNIVPLPEGIKQCRKVRHSNPWTRQLALTLCEGRRSRAPMLILSTWWKHSILIGQWKFSAPWKSFENIPLVQESIFRGSQHMLVVC